MLIVTSCDNTSNLIILEKSISVLDKENNTDRIVYFIIPNSGCTGCINVAEKFLIDNVDKEQKIKYILTNYTSKKDLSIRFKINLDTRANIILDQSNVLYANGIRTIYPIVAYFDGSYVQKIEIIKPEANLNIFSEIEDFIRF